MPSAITQRVFEGASLAQFASDCARMFDACITMRDAPIDAVVPLQLSPDLRYEIRLADIQAEIDRLSSLEGEELEAEFKEVQAKREEMYQGQLNENLKRRQAYEAMLAKVEAATWSHEELKEYMVNQLQESLRYDCFDPAEISAPPVETAEQYRDGAVAYYTQELEQWKQSHAASTERMGERNKWLQIFHEDVKAADPRGWAQIHPLETMHKMGVDVLCDESDA